MKKFRAALIFYCILSSSTHEVMSLKCRTGNQQSDDQFQKIMHVCRRRYMGYDSDNNGRGDYNGRETDSQESMDSGSDEDLFDNKFLSNGGSGGGNRYNKNDKRYDYSSRNTTRQGSGRNWSNAGRSNPNGSRSSPDQMGSTRRNMRNSADSRGDNYSRNGNGNNMNNNNMNRNNNMNNNNMNNMNGDDNGDGERKQACVIQCFFNELNLVDQRGFPERSAVTGIMLQNIQDPELRDFVEESVVECYHYLSNNGRQEKCQFSQNLLSCLAEKGSERCEDWDDN